MSNFSALKKNSRSAFDRLNDEVNKLANPSGQQNSQEDNRFWKPEVDKSGNGYAVIRFLPAPPNEDLPFVRLWDHGFQGPTGKWYIEKSLTTLGQKDPVSEYNSMLWNSGIESNKDLVRKYKRRISYISNIYVVKDPSNPANEGKVFLYQYGKKIWDKINLAMNPEFEDEQAFNPFDMWEGATFKLKIRKVEGYRNYDKSEFEAPAPLNGDDEELERIWNMEHSLQEFMDPKNFKSYDQLKQKLQTVLELGSDGQKPTPAAARKNVEDIDEDDMTQMAPRPAKTAAPVAKPVMDSPFEDDDDSIDFFKKLAEEE
jgi:gp32 DNA binding protein like